MRYCLVIAILFLSSCATQKRCYDKFGGIQTILVKDTVYIPKETVKFSLQSIIDTLMLIDTFRIEKVRVRAIFTKDTVLIECKPDTVYMEKLVHVPKIEKPESKYWQHKEFWISIVIFVLFAALVYLSRK